LGSLLRSVPPEIKKTIRRPMWDYLSTSRYQDIFNISEKNHNIIEDGSVDIGYDGIWGRPYPKQISNTIGEAKTQRRDIFQLQDVNLIHNHYPTITKDGNILIPHNISNNNKTSWPRFSKKLASEYVSSSSDHQNIDIGFLLTENSTFGWAHWCTEVLTQLYSLDNLRDDDVEDISIIFSWNGDGDEMASWQKESLDLIGFNPDYTNNDLPLNISTLLIPSYSHLTSYINTYPSPKELNWVRESLLTNIGESCSTYSSKIYISRQDSGRRKILNIDELKPILQRYGFEIYNPGEMSFKNQVKLFSQADIIVGPHGGGIMNIIFSNNATLIELFADCDQCRHQFILSNLIDITYDYVICETNDKNRHVKLPHKDLIVDIEKFEQVISSYV
jgi:hypothetical protein